MDYKAASYQQDIMNEISKQSIVHFYGPNFIDYDPNDSIDRVLSKAPFDTDLIILGHSWLNDKDGSEVDPHPKIQLKNTSIPKVVILNKEYTNLRAKLEYIRKNKFEIGFTHHHDIKKYSEDTGNEFVFWPFGFDLNRFNYKDEIKSTDIGFSGVLQNLNKNANQSDIRVKIMNQLFYTLFDIPLIKRKAFMGKNIFWNSIPRNKTGRLLGKIINNHKFLSDVDYAKMVMQTKVYINALSPMGLISPRFFECMASRTLVFCEESSLYKNIFPEHSYITFNKSLTDFSDKLLWILSDVSQYKKITDTAFTNVSNNHTWEKRIANLLKICSSQLLGIKSK